MDYTIIEDLLAHTKVEETRDHIHHHIPKHEHLLRSARLAYRLAPLLRADQRVCTRAAILHDIDSRLGTSATHGAIAARFAAEIGEPPAVASAIVSHMYPIGPTPTTREGWVLVLADKLASVGDLSQFVRGLLSGNSLHILRRLRTTDPYYMRRPLSARLWGRRFGT